MAEFSPRCDEEEPALPAKRKPDLTYSNTDEDPPSKVPKTVNGINGDAHADGGAEIARREEDNGEAKTGGPDTSGRSGADLEVHEEEEEEEEQGGEFGEADEEDDEDYDDEESDVEGDGEPPLDVKEKGVLKDDKGKGKLIVDDVDSDSDDSDDADPGDSDGNLQSGSDSDLSIDLLTEVDLDNILPSRTRQRRAQSKVVIADDRRNTDGSGGGSEA